MLLAGKAVGIQSMTPTTIEEFASQLSLEGETKNGKKTKMDRRKKIRMAMERDEINFKRNRDGTYSLADKLEKLEKKTMKEGRMEEIESAVKKINDNEGSRERKEESDRVQLYSRKRCLRRVGCAPGGEGGRNKEHDSYHN